MRSIAECLLTIACFFVPFDSLHANDRDPESPDGFTIEQIIDSWKASSERLKSARLEFETTCVATKEYVARLERLRDIGVQKGDTRPKKIDWKEIDPTHVQILRRTKVSIDGIRVRWEDFGAPENSQTPAHPFAVFASNGNVSYSFFMPLSERSGFTYPTGTVLHSPVCAMYASINSSPIRFVVAKFVSEAPAIKLKELRVHPDRVEVQSIRCVVVSEGKTNEPGTDYYLDPGKDFAIVRSQFFFPDRERLRQQIEFAYRRDEKHGWLPTGWTISLFSKDKTADEVRSSRVLSWESNPKFRDDEFDITFPPGTKIGR